MTLFPSEPTPPARLGNLPELSVTDLAGALKRTLEDAFGRVRVRGELSKVATPASGHIYTALKDDTSVIDAVCWRTQVPRLKVKPEEGLDVIITGKITTYPARSSYQLVIEQIELAGVGAILKMIEDRRIKLAAEGLFDADRKRRLPFVPRVIGVITSPTGAVIRDILHRLADRFPVQVIIWPVVVQGDTAAADVTAAINGFNALPVNGSVPRPDVLIVARGGGSIEDLMPFNDESVVRAAAASKIPLISAVGHETDTTLIDYAADQRAPTPTAAAEFAVPVRDDLIYTLGDTAKRLQQGITRHMRDYAQNITHHAARLGRPEKILELPMQRLDHADISFGRIIAMRFERADSRLNERVARLKHPTQIIAENMRVLALHSAALIRTGTNLTNDPTRRLDHTERMLETLSFTNVLARGYALVRDKNGRVVRGGKQLTSGDQVNIQFGDGAERDAKIN